MTIQTDIVIPKRAALAFAATGAVLPGATSHLGHLYPSDRLGEDMSVLTLAQRLSHTDPARALRKYVHHISDDYEDERRWIDRALRASAGPRSGADLG